MPTRTHLPDERPSAGGDRRWLIWGAVLAVAVGLAYANSFSVPLLLDDWVTILNNPRLRQLWPLWSALSPPEGTGLGGRPIANLSFVLNFAITGESVPGLHAVNLVIHFVAGLTLFGIVRRTLRNNVSLVRLTGRADEVAFAAAAWWLLHPVQTQSVTYVSQRTESLMGLFYFFTVYAFIRGTEAGAPRRWIMASVVSCFAGMATKEGMVTVPVMVLLYDYAFLSGSFVVAWRRRWGIYAALAASWILLAFLIGGLRGRGVGFGLGMTWWSYLLIECRAIVHYLGLTLWPAKLVFDYGTDLGLPGAVEMLCAFGLGALGLGTVYSLWRVPAMGFLGAWFLITLAPTSSIVPIPMQPISENRIYVPTAAVIVGVVVFLHHVLRARRLTLFVLIAVGLAGMTAARNRDYRSEIAIWTDTVAKMPRSSRAHSNLGHVLQNAGRLDEARSQQEIALQLRPNYSEAHSNLAAIFGQLGNHDAAIEHARRAAEIDPRNATAFFNLGVAYEQKGKTLDAITAYEAVVRLNSDNFAAHTNLAMLLLRVGRVSESMLHSSAAVQLKPDAASSRYALGCGLALSERREEAIAMFREAVRLQPTHFESWQNLGTVLAQLGRAAEAVVALESAVRLNPNEVATLFALGNAWLVQEKFPEAIAAYEAALKLNSQLADVHLNLGVALGKAGRIEAATAHLETAKRLNPQLQLATDLLEALKAGSAARKP